MKTAFALATLLLDPRGRIGRRDLFVSATAMLGIEALLLLPAPEMIAVPGKALALWIGTAAIIKRLRDIGLSGWWVPAGIGGLCMWTALLALGSLVVAGSDVMAPGTAASTILLGLIMLPAVGITLWLHLLPGDTAANRFGAPTPAWPSRDDALPGRNGHDEPAHA